MPETIADSLQIQNGGGATGLSSRSRYDGGRQLAGNVGTYSNRSDVLPLLNESNDRSVPTTGGIQRGGIPAGNADYDRSLPQSGGTRRTDTGRTLQSVIDNVTNGGGNGTSPTPLPSPSSAGDPAKEKTPFDFSLADLFRGFFNEPVRGSSNKQGEFLFIPPASAQSSGPSTIVILLILAIVGVGGYYAYRKVNNG